MDPLVKGVLMGAVGASSFATLLYAMNKKKNDTTQGKPTKTTAASVKKDQEPFYALLGDIGGTNVRYVLKRMDPVDRKKNNVIKEMTIDIQTSPSFESSIRVFLAVSLSII